MAKSQLRAARSGRTGPSFFTHVAILAVVDVVCFLGAAAVGDVLVQTVSAVSPSEASSVATLVKEGLVFIPVLIPSAVLITGVIFELSVSSKFASSDAINWLPVTQLEYVAASTLSIAYGYSVIPSILLGLTLFPAVSSGYGWQWGEMLVLSLVSLFYGGAVVEILRSAINKVSNAVMGRARRGVLVIRLAVTVAAILSFQVIFNFVFLIDLINRFESALNVVAFLPVLWPSLAVKASLAGETAENIAFVAATVGFTVAMLAAAVWVRARYWSPVPSQISVTAGEYKPAARPPLGLRLFGLDSAEATLVRKDLKGLARRRELLQYFSVPFVIGIVFVFEVWFNPSGGVPNQFQEQFPIFFVGGLFALNISAISFGQEGRSASLLYSLPLTPDQVLRAKVFISLLLGLLATVGIFVVMSLLARPPAFEAFRDLAVGVAITVEEVFIGVGFGAKYPDFQERPRPRFLNPLAIILMMVVGLAAMAATALPSFLSAILTSFPGLEREVQSLYLASAAFAVAVIGLAYSWARRGTKKLMAEFVG